MLIAERRGIRVLVLVAEEMGLIAGVIHVHR